MHSYGPLSTSMNIKLVYLEHRKQHVDYMFTSRVNSQKLCVSVHNMFTLRRTNFCSHLVDSTFIMMLSDNPSKCQQSTYIDADDIITMMLLCEPQKCRQSSHIHATNMFTFEKFFHSNEHKSHTFR